MLAGPLPDVEQFIAGTRQRFTAHPKIVRAAPGRLLIAGGPFGVIIITACRDRFWGLRAESQQGAPVFTTRQFIDKTRRQRLGGWQRRVLLDKVIHLGEAGLAEILRQFAVFQIRVKRVITQRRHQLCHDIHLITVPRLLDLQVTLTLRVERVRHCRPRECRQAQPHGQQPPLVYLDHTYSFLAGCVAGTLSPLAALRQRSRPGETGSSRVSRPEVEYTSEQKDVQSDKLRHLP
ncbi:hypothetical protein D3C79_648040 [compost metagenome]